MQVIELNRRNRRSAASLSASVLLGAVFSLGTAGPISAQPQRRTCTDISLPIYFPARSSTVDPASKAAMATALRPRANCRTVSATVVGRGDAFGPGKNNPALARKRAEAAASELLRIDFFKGDVEIIPRAGTSSSRRVLERRATVHLHRTRF